jgi:ABC-type phosphate transport system substrate-binding protein
MTDLREPKSHAILIGAGTYDSSLLEDVPAVRETVSALLAALRGRCGMTGADITTIQDRPRVDEVLKEIAARARDTTGVLLVYYVGHGRPDQDGNLYLAMHETDPASALWDRTAVLYPQIARLLRGIQARAVVVILDCCFSGRALPSGGERGPVMPAGRGGGFVLTSAAHEEHTLAGAGEQYTTFTGQLLALLENGDPDLDSPDVTLADAFRYLLGKSAQPGLPTPQRETTGTADEIVLAPNHARDQAETDAAPADDPPPAVTSDVALPGDPGPDGGPLPEDDSLTTLSLPLPRVRERDQGGQGTGGAAPPESPGNAAGFPGASPAPAAPGTAVASPATSPGLYANLPDAQAPGSAPATSAPEAVRHGWAGPQPPQGQPSWRLQPPGGGGSARGRGRSVWVWIIAVIVVLVVVALVAALLRGCASVPTQHSSTEKCPAGKVRFVGSTAFEPTAQAAKTAYEKQCGQSDVIITVVGGDSAYGVSQAQGSLGTPSAGNVVAMYDGTDDTAEPLKPMPVGVLLIFAVVAHNGVYPDGNITTSGLYQLYFAGGEARKVAVGRKSGSGSRKALLTLYGQPEPGPKVPGNCPQHPVAADDPSPACTEDNTLDLLAFVDTVTNAVGYARASPIAGGHPAGYPGITQLTLNGVAATPANVRHGHYPFVAPEHLYLPPSPSKLATAFADFLAHYAQAHAQSTINFIACSQAPPVLAAQCAS